MDVGASNHVQTKLLLATIAQWGSASDIYQANFAIYEVNSTRCFAAYGNVLVLKDIFLWILRNFEQKVDCAS